MDLNPSCREHHGIDGLLRARLLQLNDGACEIRNAHALRSVKRSFGENQINFRGLPGHQQRA
jgi:hypothetical protein